MRVIGGTEKGYKIYLNGRRNLVLTLSIDNLRIIRWFVDALYVIHDDCKGHTGSMMTLGSGAIISFSQKQKINGKSLTESELIEVDDTLPKILWTRYCMESQGYKVEDNILFQDNKSAILLEEYGKT